MFAVADYESKLKIKKFEIADLMWQTKMQNLLDWDILYAGFLGSLIDAQNSVIHNGGSNMADEKINKLGWNLVPREFWGRWLRIRIWNSEIKNGGSNIAAKNTRNDLIWMKLGTRETQSSKIKNSRSNIVSKIQKVTRFRKKSVLKIPGSKSELKSEIKNKMKKN